MGIDQPLTGLSAAKASMISTLSPFGLFLYVGGNKLIRLKSSEPPRTPCIVCVSASTAPLYHDHDVVVAYCSVKSNCKRVVAVRCRLLWNQVEVIFYPIIASLLDRYLGGPKHFASQSTLERSCEGFSLKSALDVKRPSVLLDSDIHSPVPGIGKANRLVPR